MMLLSRRLAALLWLMPCCLGSAPAQTDVPVKILPRATGTFSEAVSTSFQPAPWTDPAFLAHPEIPSLLTELNPQHVNVQVIDPSIPETAPGVWDFTALDRQLQPILSAADRSPLIQLARAPAFLYRSRTHFVTPAFIAGYAAYCAGMVAHYDAPGAPNLIRFWGILNEPNYFGISPLDYVHLYNAAVSAMLAVDPTIRIVALELGGVAADERRYLPVFARDVRARVDIIGVHFYATCDQTDSDQTLLDTVPAFANQLAYIRRQFPRTPIWITENNVNADFADPRGNSTCNPTHPFAQDLRGSSAFFAAWRAYEFSHFGQPGAAALYHWVFSGDRQFGEYNTEATPAQPQLSFWVDIALGRYFPSKVPRPVPGRPEPCLHHSGSSCGPAARRRHPSPRQPCRCQSPGQQRRRPHPHGRP